MTNKTWPNIHDKGRRAWLDKMIAQPLWDSWSNELYPQNLKEAFYWGNWLRTRFGDVVSAISRGVCWFLNGVELDNEIEDMDLRDKYTKELNKVHKINKQLLTVGLDLEFYGNSFTTVVQPITRVLVCPRCRQHRYLKALVRGEDYDFKDGKFISSCSGCRKYRGAFEIKDHIDSRGGRPLNVINWNPLSIDIDHCVLTGAEKVTFSPNKVDRSFIEDEAQSTSLETLPKALLDSIVKDAPLEFSESSCLHLAVPTDAVNSSDMGGWGLPPFLPAFRYVVMMMLLDRQTEAAVKDFILPIRLLFPDPSLAKGGSDPIQGTNIMHMGQLRGAVETALRSQAYQQSSWQMVPAPVQQLTLGGDGKAIVPVDVQQYVKERFLDSMQVPAEFHKITLGTAQASVQDMKQFEQNRAQRVDLYDDWIHWYLKRCTALLNWPEMSGEVLRPSISADPQKASIMMQLQQMGGISMTTLIRSLGINPLQERSRLREEQIRQAKDQRETQAQINNGDMLNSIITLGNQQNIENALATAQSGGAQGGDPAAQGGGGAPAGGGGGGGAQAPAPSPNQDPMSQIDSLRSMITPEAVSPDQLNADADLVANILLHTPIGVPRSQIFTKVKAANQTLYDIAKSRLEKLENQAKQQGVEAARQGQM